MFDTATRLRVEPLAPAFLKKFGRKNDFAEDHSTENNWLVTVSEFFSSKFLV